MAWRCLTSILFNGNVYNLPLLSQTDIDWLSVQGVSPQYKETTLLSDNGAVFPFKATTSDYNRGTVSDSLFNFDYIWNSGFLTYSVKNSGGTQLLSITTQRYNTNYSGIIVDDETQKAMIFRFFENENRLYSCSWGSNQNLLDAYTAIMGSIPVLYQWSSVPTISGKNGILSLATLKASKINDGEPVSNGSASDFSSLPSSSKISVLVAAVMPEDPGNKTSVVVTYYIGSLESGEYTSAKVAAKKNSIPESLEDADVVMDIPAESGKYSVGSLEELTKYYFVIFVADSNGNNATSNPESIRTGEVVAPFREEVVVEKKTGDDEYTLVYTWTGKWGKQDDAIAEGFEVSTFDVLLEESQLVQGFEESYAENNWISEAQDAEIQT